LRIDCGAINLGFVNGSAWIIDEARTYTRDVHWGPLPDGVLVGGERC
jgi:hypothetical protein